MTLTGLKILARTMSTVVRVGVEGSLLTSPASTRSFTCADVKPSVVSLKSLKSLKSCVGKSGVGKSGVDGKIGKSGVCVSCKPYAGVEPSGDVEPPVPGADVLGTDGLDLSSITKVSL